MAGTSTESRETTRHDLHLRYTANSNTLKILVRTPEAKRLLAIPRYKVIGRECVDWIHLDQDRNQVTGYLWTP
jgi:hypothetical protein